MLRTRPASLLIALALTALNAPRASAEPMDPTVHRFGISAVGDHTPCSFDGVNIRAGQAGASPQCVADNESFQRLVLQLGGAMSLGGLSPARTVGYRHFYIGMEVGVTSLGGSTTADPPSEAEDPSVTSDQWRDWNRANFMRRGTQGNDIPADEPMRQQELELRYRRGNRFADDRLIWTRLAFRKGLPLGLEIGGSVGRFMQTSMWTFSFEIKWAMLEGFRRRWPSAVPDFAVRAGVTTVAGNRGFTLTVPTFGATLSKPFVLGDTVTLSPYVTGQAVWIMADSEVIDVTPGNASDNDGTESLITFDRVRAWYPRVAGGIEVRYSRFVTNAMFRMDLGNPMRNFADATSGPKQWTIDVGLGVIY